MTEGQMRYVQRKMHEKDDSHLWPISGKFNATSRAIRGIGKAMRDGLVIDTPLEYEYALEEEISRIVNDESNW